MHKMNELGVNSCVNFMFFIVVSSMDSAVGPTRAAAVGTGASRRSLDSGVDEGLSHHEAARRFGIDRRTMKKMLSYPVPPGYRRTKPVRRPKRTALMTTHPARRVWHRRG